MPNPTDSATVQRIAFLDGLRGLAILLVLLFHAYVRWPEVVPFGDRFRHVPPFSVGWLGVELFFMISGFVIFMTLERCRGFADFALRRWHRLFPAMLVVSLLVLVTAPLLPERPAGQPGLAQLVPGLTFIEPRWLAMVGLPAPAIEGAFWSLFVEAQFYCVAGIAFFSGGAKRALWVLAAFYAAALLSGPWRVLLGNPMHNDLAVIVWELTDRMGATAYGWFIAGALFFRWTAGAGTGARNAGILCALLAALVEGGGKAGPTVAALAIAATFISTLMQPAVARMIANRALLLLGFASYPLYLVHENMMVALIAKLGHAVPAIPALLLPVLPMLAVIGLGWLIAARAEPLSMKAIDPFYRWLRRVTNANGEARQAARLP